MDKSSITGLAMAAGAVVLTVVAIFTSHPDKPAEPIVKNGVPANVAYQMMKQDDDKLRAERHAQDVVDTYEAQRLNEQPK